jgi:3-deoxy-D-manno-octulosonate 8-phosphate phosphatase (KDO 8-P phosphatase)
MNLVTDFDGIFTSSSFLYTKEGKTGKLFSPNDGHMFKLISQNLNYLGIDSISILTGEDKEEGMNVTKKRLTDLGLIEYLNFCPGRQKIEWLSERYGLNNVIYFGDDFYDIEIFEKCFHSACPSNAMRPLKNVADYVSPYKGGEEAFVDMSINVIETILGKELKYLLSR